MAVGYATGSRTFRSQRLLNCLRCLKFELCGLGNDFKVAPKLPRGAFCVPAGAPEVLVGTWTWSWTWTWTWTGMGMGTATG
eukprot:4425860-Alexandrium_andersonii.AAC.1